MTRIPLGLYCRQSPRAVPPLDPDDFARGDWAGFRLLPLERFATWQCPFGKYDQIFVPEYKVRRDGERGIARRFLEDYLFQSRVTDFAASPARR